MVVPILGPAAFPGPGLGYARINYSSNPPQSPINSAIAHIPASSPSTPELISDFNKSPGEEDPQHAHSCNSRLRPRTRPCHPRRVPCFAGFSRECHFHADSETQPGVGGLTRACQPKANEEDNARMRFLQVQEAQVLW